MQKTTFFLFFICGLFIHSSAIDLIGTVKDKSTGEPLPYATVARMDGQSGVITDENGSFRFELEKISKKDTLVISYLGYKALKRTTHDISKSPDCLLDRYDFEIAEVEIRPVDIENILRKTYDEFYKNHVHKNIATQSYYREQFFEGNTCVRYGEAVIQSRFFEEKGKDMSVVEPILARSIEDSSWLKSFNDIFNSKKMVIPFGIDTYFDNKIAESISVEQFHKFMGKFFFEKKNDGFKVDYQLRKNYMLNGRDNYFIKFDIEKRNKDVASGHFLIDGENYGIAAFEIKLSKEEDLTKVLIPPRFRLILKILGYSVDIVDYEAKINNRLIDGKWYLGSGIQVLQGGIAKRGDWFRGKVVNEFHSYSNATYKKSETAGKRFMDQRMNNFSSDFWGKYPYSAIQPKQQEYIERIIASNHEFSGKVLSDKVRKKVEKAEAKKEAANQ
ncbi:MAG: carboxypeptidase-like regulatory domain-containing protein [Bacteroidetes bacterium]|nr:carboxypeptidase-like regulatory domain-containing protein [Bacteroidota bacterium]